MNINDNSQPTTSSRTTTLRTINDRVNRVHVICQESEAIAADSLEELANQKETLNRAKNRLNETNVELGETNRQLKSIYRRVASNKFLLSFIILLELMIIGAQIYTKVKKQ